MKTRVFIILFILFSIVDLFAGDPKFYLSQTRAELGEPVFVIVEAEGSAEVRVIEKEFQGHGIRAVYWGMEDSTTIVNFKAYRKKILKYRLVVSAPGKYSVPEVAVDVEGKRYGASGLMVEFGPRRAATRNPNSIWNRFFSTEDTQGPADGDLKVVFQLDKKEVWVGEPVLGFFALYYRNAIRPYFDRDPSSSIEFPYFRSEVITGVGLTIPESVIYEGVQYDTSPYNKEFFVLTPLKRGEFSLGSTGFHLEGQLQSYFHMRTVKTIPGRIQVRDLPLPSPPNFGGAVGKFEMTLEDIPKETNLGDPFQFRLVLRGKGNLSSIKDPLRSSCPKRDCYPDITFLQLRPQKEFKELDPGEYGFYLNHSFSYSVLPKEEGTWQESDLKFSYFDPKFGKYTDVSVRFPPVHVGPPRPKSNLPESEKSSGVSYGYVWILTLGIFAGALGFFLTVYWKGKFAADRLLKRLDLWIGSKRGFVLKHSALGRGLSEEEASLLAGWKSEDIPLTETYRRLGPVSKTALLKIADRLMLNVKEDETR